MILHIDVDGFYCACELRRNPRLRGKPVAVTQGNSGGFVALNQEARSAGLMKGDGIGAEGHKNLEFFRNRPEAIMEHVLRKCPDLLIMQMDTAWYRKCSQDILKALQGFDESLVVEKASIDDFFVDASRTVDRITVSNSEEAETWYDSELTPLDEIEGFLERKACVLAARLREHVTEILNGITISVGIGPNKLIARLVSKRKGYPNSQTLVKDVEAVLMQTPFRVVPGLKGKLGAAIAEKFPDAETLFDLQSVSLRKLEDIAASSTKAEWMFNTARGIDNEEVEVRGPLKSILSEKSFPPVELSSAVARQELEKICSDLLERLIFEKKQNSRIPSSITISWRSGYGKGSISSKTISPFPVPLEESKAAKLREVMLALITKNLPENINRFALSATRFKRAQSTNLLAMFAPKRPKNLTRHS